MNPTLQNNVGEIHPGALFSWVDEATVFVKIGVEREQVDCVSVFIELQQFKHIVPLGDTITIIARCGKAGRRLHFFHAEFYHKQDLIAKGTHISTPVIAPKL